MKIYNVLFEILIFLILNLVFDFNFALNAIATKKNFLSFINK